MSRRQIKKSTINDLGQVVPEVMAVVTSRDDVQVFDLMSEAEAKAKLKTMGSTKADKTVVEDPVETTLDELSRMTKAQLEEFAREFGVELDRREKKNELVNQAYEAQFDG